MVVGAMLLLVLMAFAPMEMEVLGAGEFNPFFSTADIPRIFPGSGGGTSQCIDPDSKSLLWNMSCWLGRVHSRLSSSQSP